MGRIGQQLMTDSKAAIALSEKVEHTDNAQGRDLLSLLVKANTASDLPENQRLSDADVLARKFPMSSTNFTLAKGDTQRCPLS